MRTFRNKPGSWSGIRTKTLLFTVPLAVVAGAAGIFASGVNDENGEFSTLTIAVPIIIAAMSFGLFRGGQINRRAWESFELIVTDGEIVRRQAGTPDIRIQRSEVRFINEVSGRGIAVTGLNRFHCITVTSQLESYDELVALLRQWNVPWQNVDRRSFNMFLVVAAPLIGVGLLVTTLTTTGAVSVLSSLGVIAFLLWCHRGIRHSPHLDERIKKNSWSIWIVIVMLTVRTLYMTGLIHF